MKHLRAYNGGSLPAATAVNETFLIGFAEYLLGRIRPNSVRTYLQKLYAIVRASLRGQNLYVALPRICDLIPVYESGPQTAFSTEELRRLMETPCPHESTKRAFLFSCFTGLRISDVRTLDASHIVRTGQGFCVVKRQVKTRRTVEVPLGSRALALLSAQGKGADFGREEGRHTAAQQQGTGRRPLFDLMSLTTIRNDLQVWARQAGIGRRISFHSARHTFASLLLDSEAGLYVISKLCGHHHVSTTEGYLHLAETQRWDAIKRMEQRV